MDTRVNEAESVASSDDTFATDPVLPADAFVPTDTFVFNQAMDSGTDTAATQVVDDNQTPPPAAPDMATASIIDSEWVSIFSDDTAPSEPSPPSGRFDVAATNNQADGGSAAFKNDTDLPQISDDDATPARTSHMFLADFHVSSRDIDNFSLNNSTAPSLDASNQQGSANAFTPLAYVEPAHWVAPYSLVAAGESPEAFNPVGFAPDPAGDGPAEVLVDGDGEVVAVASNSAPGSAGGSGTSGSGTGSATSGGGATTSPFVINVIYDASVNNAPAGFKAAIAAVVQYFESQFTDKVTINIDVGYGEVGGYTLGAGALGESLTYLSSYSYSQVKNALTADAKTADDTTAVASLPSSSPVSGTYWVSTAEAKAIGLLGPSSNIDGYVGFAAGNYFDYDNSNGVTAGQYDFFGVVAHEISEVMGRALLVGGKIGSTPNGYYPLDLFHYAANGVRDFSGTTPGYFSINNGATNLDSFNTNPGGDFGDWASSAGNDSFLAFSPSGVVDAISQTDLRVLDVIGWDRASSGSTPPPPPPPPAQADLVITGFSFVGSHFSYHVSDTGAGAAAASTVGIYVSSTATGANTLIGTTATGALAAGTSDTESGNITWSSNTTPGTYYISVAADYKNMVSESNESNNQSGKIALVLGNSGVNTLTGTPGNDVLIGLGGKDTLTGGAGADQFLFNTALNKSTSVATITDFSHAQGDKIDLDHTAFTALTPESPGAALAASDFYASSNGAAHLATDRILYNTITGVLSYDPDGTGPTAAIQFASLMQHPTLTSGDFVVA